MRTANKAMEAVEDREAVLIGVEKGLFLGNHTAAEDAGLFAQHGITQSLNLAVNIDPGPMTLADGTVVRRAKIGLIDGPGNHPLHLAAATLAIAGMVAQAAPGKPSYPAHRPGGLLVHCRGGRSRSIAALALFLAWRQPQDYADLATALDRLGALRGLGPDQPHRAMREPPPLPGRCCRRPALRRLRAFGRPWGGGADRCPALALTFDLPRWRRLLASPAVPGYAIKG